MKYHILLDNSKINLCNNFINNNYKLYKAKYRSEKTFIVEEAIMREILENGPVTGSMQLMGDFGNYSNIEIYKAININNDMNELQSIEIYRWGVENKIPYWKIWNSYGRKWRINGTVETYATTT